MLTSRYLVHVAPCRRRRARVPVPPASPGTRDPPGGARTVLRLRPLTLDVARARSRSPTRTHPLGPVLDERVPGFARAVQGKLAALGAVGAPGLHCEPLAQSTCRVVPGAPVVRWKWSPPRPVATAHHRQIHPRQPPPARRNSAHLVGHLDGTAPPELIRQLGDHVDDRCNHGGLLFSLALARRALCAVLAEPSRFEVRLRFENSELDLGPSEWPANGDSCWPGSPTANWWT